ncbi:transposase [Paucibacter oligotrophus]|uniref:Transposase n=2 Tax=Roseateles oligotrophus TaxID=1769250 RepID=A0ABT2YMV4_9BURK|nr:transposase [Roseateles oligotrophus]
MMTTDKTVKRRHYSDELKARVVAECDEAGASVAKVAMSHGINANIVHGWRQLARAGHLAVPTKMVGFLSLPLGAVSKPAAPTDIRIELRRGDTTISITWPTSAATEFAAWSRELLR